MGVKMANKIKGPLKNMVCLLSVNITLFNQAHICSRSRTDKDYFTFTNPPIPALFTNFLAVHYGKVPIKSVHYGKVLIEYSHFEKDYN